jgi:ferritin-like metal-binding protein YciE
MTALANIANTQELFFHQLASLYDAEHTFHEGQQEMARNATDEDLRAAIDEHIQETQEQIRNIEWISGALLEPWRQTSESARGMVSEARETIGKAQTDALRDVAIASAIYKVEHFEIGAYRSLVTGADVEGWSEAEQRLRTNLEQEEEMARIAQDSAERLLRKAIEQEGREPDEEGLLEKVRERLATSV